jgi:hypothetical protein
MSYLRQLPDLTLSTAVAPQTGTWVDVDDAETISFIINGTTTAPGIQVQASLTTQSTGIFVSILRPVDSTAPSAMVATSSGVYTLWPAHYRQVRFNSTGVIAAAGGISIIGVKSVNL